MLFAILFTNALGITLMQANLSVTENQEQGARAFYAECRMADFWVETPKLPLVELDRLRQIPGITELRPRIVQKVTVDLPDVNKPLSGQVISLPENPAPVINNVRILRGGYFTTLDLYEVLVLDAFARARGLAPGDKLRLLVNGKQQELTITGTVGSAEYVFVVGPGGLLPSPSDFGIFYVKQKLAEDLFDYQGAANGLVGLLDPVFRDHPQPVLNEIETRLAPFGNSTTTPRATQTSHFVLDMEFDNRRTTGLIMPTICVVASTLILNVLMTRIAEQQRTIVGTLRALGYSRWELVRHFIKFGAVIGLASGTLGIIGGFGMAEWLLYMMAPFLDIPDVWNRPLPHLAAFLLCVSVTLSTFGTLRGVLHVMRLRPAEAMRPKPPVTAQKFFLEAWPSLWRKLGFRWQVVLRDLWRQKVRTLTGIVVGAAAASLIFMALFIQGAYQEALTFQYEKVIKSDYELTLQKPLTYGAVFEADRLAGVDYVEPIFTVSGTFRHGHRTKEGGVTGILPTARLTVPRDRAGRPVAVPPAGLLVSAAMARALDVSVGETLILEPLKGPREEVAAPVVSIVDCYLGLAVYANFDYLNALLGEEAAVTGLQVTCDPAVPAADFYRDVKTLPRLEGINSIADLKEEMHKFLGPMYAMLGVLIVFAGMIFAGSILNSSLISMAERQQVIATFRVMGYTSSEVGGIFLRESLCINLLGTLLALPVGYWMSYGLTRIVDTDLIRIPFIVQPACYWATVVLGMCFTLLAHLIVQRLIVRLDWKMALNVKE
jgi:putative ABC transport system permease protein